MCDIFETNMLEALRLAKLGVGLVEPNPMVGAVITRDNEIIASGYHHKFGDPHAERDALKNAADDGINVQGAEMYVTLEPCCHHGKTPPCTDAIVEAGISKVYVAMTDPDTRVAGKGIQILRNAGIEVVTGICESQARRLLGAYCKLRTQHRPWVICKWAQTADGFLSLPQEKGRWITNEMSRSHVHLLRSWCDAILVGINTVLKDNPTLNNRSGAGNQPLRIVLDPRLRIPRDCNLVRTAEDIPLLVVTAVEKPKPQTLFDNFETLSLSDFSGQIDLPALLDELGQRELTYLLVEGGPTVIKSFIDTGLADELYVYTAPIIAGDPKLPHLDIKEIKYKLNLTPEQKIDFDNDTFESFLITN